MCRQCLQKNYKVTAVVRNIAKLEMDHENLRKVEANVFDSSSLAPVFKGMKIKEYSFNHLKFRS